MTPTEYYLAQLASKRAALEAETRAAVAQARADKIPWQDIGNALGMTRQAAWEKYHAKA